MFFRVPTEGPTIKTTETPAIEDVNFNDVTEIPAIEDVNFNDVTSDLDSCESVQVNLSQNGIVDIHNGYRADVSLHFFFKNILKL